MNRNAANRQGAISGDTGGRSSFESSPVNVGLPKTSLSDAETWCDVSSKPISSSLSAHRLNTEVWRLVLTDKLTGLCNQHGFIALADQQWRISQRENREMVFVKFELGNLKQIRESSERGESDFAVIALARILMKTFRRSDVLCRWDGGQFMVLAVDAESLNEPMLRARIQSQIRKAGGEISRFSLVLNARLTRVSPRNAGSLEHVLTCLDRDFADFKRTWSGAEGARPMIVVQDASQ